MVLNFDILVLGLDALHMAARNCSEPAFKPTFMEKSEKQPDQVTELYFWGGHGGVGGSEPRQPECGQITLRFLVDEMKERKLGLTFNMDEIPEYPSVDVEGRLAPPVGIQAVVAKVLGKYIRPITDKNQVHPTAINRYQQVSSWRPLALEDISKDILS